MFLFKTYFIQKRTEKGWIAGQSYIYPLLIQGYGNNRVYIIIIQWKRGNSNIIYNVSAKQREINNTTCSIWKLVLLLLKGNLERET